MHDQQQLLDTLANAKKILDDLNCSLKHLQTITSQLENYIINPVHRSELSNRLTKTNRAVEELCLRLNSIKNATMVSNLFGLKHKFLALRTPNKSYVSNIQIPSKSFLLKFGQLLYIHSLSSVQNESNIYIVQRWSSHFSKGALSKQTSIPLLCIRD